EGYRDIERPPDKPPGTVRIAVLGDSYVSAVQVAWDSTFVVLLQRRLEACGAFPGRRVEVLNFGVGGYGTAQEYLTLERRVWAYAPDLVILAFLTGNDLENNSRALMRESWRPYYVHRNGTLVLDDSFRSRGGRERSVLTALRHFLYDHSRVVQL